MANDRREPTGSRLPAEGKGIVLGAGAGIALGAAFCNPGVGMVLGAALGLIFGPALLRRLG